MNQDHHNMNTGGGQPPGSSESQVQRVQVQSQQQQQNNLPATTSATDLRVNSAAVNVALSSVAKYWVFTNLFPGPIPQVSVYGLPAGARIENGKPIQDLGQAHASILNGDPNIILGHHAGQSQVTVSAPGGQQIPVSQIIATQSGQTHEALVAHSQQQAELVAAQSAGNNGQVSVNAGQATHQQGHHTQQHMMQQQLMAQARPDHNNQQIQLTVSEDGIVTVVEPAGSKLVDKEELHEAIKMPNDHTLTVHQLQQIVGQQVLDSVVRIEQATGEPANILVTHNPDGTTSIEASAADPLIVKDEKNSNKIETAQFAIPTEIKDIKGIDLKNVGTMGMEGAVVKISAGASDHDLHAMYKVNVEDLSQLLAYHEVFGKLNSEGQQQQAKEDLLTKTPRKRVANFTADEKAILAQLIKKRPIVESKITDGKSIAKKQAAWDIITQEFNCNANVHKRETITLKRAWDNMKAFTRKTRAIERGNLLRTGGGPHAPPLPPQHGAIISMVEEAAPVMISEINNVFDSDGAILDRAIDNSQELDFLENNNTPSELIDALDISDIGTKTVEDIIEVQDCYKMNGTQVEDTKLSTDCIGLASTIKPRDLMRRPTDYIRREAVMRIKLLENKKTIEMQILKTQVISEVEVEVEAGTSAAMSEAESSPGHHSCDICGKIFQFRYQLIVHRRYHGESKPFTCQVCGSAFTNPVELSRHGKCHLAGDPNERHAKRLAQDKPYACTTCHKTFSRKEHLDNHVRSHTGETPYRCEFCAKTFTRKEHMVNHVRKHTGETPHRCDICKKSFTRKEHFMNHVMWHTGETPHHCTICGKKYTRKEHLVNHMRSHTNDTPFRCELCGKSFTRKEHFTNHILWHTGETPHRCDFCSKTFTRKEHLLNHVRQHTGESPHRCNFCSKSFTRREHLVNHVRQHTGETPFQCGYCPKAFTRKDHLVNHVRQHTGESPHKCSYCTKSFTRKEHLTNHVRQHTGESPHRCTFCAKSFTRKEHLTNHVRQHTGETPHKCTYCPRAFARKEHLNNHIRQHTGVTPHSCSYCSKSFTRKEHLVNHIRQHTGETPFKCTFCSKSFSRKEHLNNHVNLHTGETPHKCPFCTKTFSRKEHLTNHVRIHTGESPHRCDFCQKTFTRKEHLTNHLKQHTGDSAHVCKVCSKNFTRKEHLVTHMRSHSCGERPFSCGECGKSFPLKGNLLFHERSHAKNNANAANKPYRCEVCSKEFLCKGHLVSHRRTHAEWTEGAPTGETPTETEDCTDNKCIKVEPERTERKHEVRTTVETRPDETNVAQSQPNTPNVMITNNQQVRAATVGAVGAAGSMGAGGAVGAMGAVGAAPTFAPHHAAAGLAHHPVTVNY